MADTAKRFYSLVVNGTVAELDIYGDIVSEAYSWDESDMNVYRLSRILEGLEGVSQINVNINSYGGEVAEGIAIYNALRRHSAKIVTRCDGMACSIASVIFMAGDERVMYAPSMLMIHNASSMAWGTAADLRKAAEDNEKITSMSKAAYMERVSITEKELTKLMDAETWLNAEEAREAGFLVDDYAGEMKAAASLTRRAFAKAPDAAKALVEFHDRKPVNSDTSEVSANATTAKAVGSGEASGAVAGAVTVGVPTDNWEARFKGLSQKFNNLQKKGVEMLAAAEKKHADDIAARDAENANLKTQLETSAKDLADAKAKVSELSAKLEEQTQALQKATADLAQTRDSLKAAEDKATKLEATSDALTAGVLTPPAAGTYAEQMKAAKTPEEREALRAKKRAGKIK